MLRWICAALLLSAFVQCLGDVQHEQGELTVTERPVLYVSTLDGTMYCVYKDTGEVKWKFKDDPILTLPAEISKKSAVFLPDPTDGSLYAYRGPNEGLEKLSFTIPELVHASPCRSSDGVLYVGRKQDVWRAIDPQTGRLHQTMTADGTVATCPTAQNQALFFLGRTEYTVTMYDSSTREQSWNVTFKDYAHAQISAQRSDVLPMVSNSDGLLAVVDTISGRLLWQQELSSPVMAVYSGSLDGLRRIVTTRLARDTFLALTQTNRQNAESAVVDVGQDLLSVLFVGSQNGSAYAFPSMASSTNLLQPNIPLLPGPDEGKLSKGHADSVSSSSMTRKSQSVTLFKYYQLPKLSLTSLEQLARKNQERGMLRHSRDTILVDSNSLISSRDQLAEKATLPTTQAPLPDRSEPSWPGNVNYAEVMWQLWPLAAGTVLLSMLVAVAVTHLSIKKGHSSSSEGSQSSSTDIINISRNSSNSGSVNGSASANGKPNGESASPSDSRGLQIIGKISFRASDLIGRGSEGTCVFRGKFDNREVAIKRVLCDGFTLALREVDLLRESDDHPNVIRYYCTEETETFRFIALELCQGSVKEYVDSSSFDRSQITSKELLRQMMAGLTHLHSLGIVHRDIKPQNVLISYPSKHGRVRALISDFGLCKKIADGRASFTIRSGVTGTEGWIAPEAMSAQRVTYAVDIFAAGCVVYYVLSGGSHPFDPPLHRQANILNEKKTARLGDIEEDTIVAQDLISRMVRRNPDDRPPSKEVLSHCLFWTPAKQLTFFQDVSDRIEKEPTYSPIVQELENSGSFIVYGDWMQRIDGEVRNDLGKFRKYQGSSVRDLLRAMRNKKHHYRELPPAVQAALGPVPAGFVQYFTKLFPRLLLHTYQALRLCQDENNFVQYYNVDNEL